MNDPNLNLLEAAVRLLKPLLDELVFVGGRIDVIAVVDGRPQIVDDVRNAPDDVRGYIASEIAQLLATRQFLDALPGFLLPDSASQARQALLRERLSALAKA